MCPCKKMAVSWHCNVTATTAKHPNSNMKNQASKLILLSWCGRWLANTSWQRLGRRSRSKSAHVYCDHGCIQPSRRQVTHEYKLQHKLLAVGRSKACRTRTQMGKFCRITHASNFITSRGSPEIPCARSTKHNKWWYVWPTQRRGDWFDWNIEVDKADMASQPVCRDLVTRYVSNSVEWFI